MSKENVCTKHRCVKCCYETEMMLLEEDVERIVRLGYKEDFFATTSDGFKLLVNSGAGRCVFHDGRQCTIYASRPEGCKLYPIIFNEDTTLPVKDEFCPYRDEFSLPWKTKVKLHHLYRRLMDERGSRKSQKSGDDPVHEKRE